MTLENHVPAGATIKVPVPVRPPKTALWIGRVLGAIPVLMLAMSATMKLAHPAMVIEGMKQHGYPEHLLLPLGIVELSVALLYCIPRTAVLGAILITGYLGGAVATHVRVGEASWIFAALLGAIAWLGLLLREPRLRPLLPLRRLE